MKSYLPTIGLLAVSLAASGAYAGNHRQGELYTSLSGDISYPHGNTNVTGSTSGTIKHSFSSGGNIALGYEPLEMRSADGDVRFEVEGGYHALGLKDITIGGTTNSNPKGDLSVTTLMGNVYYDIRTNSNYTPYIGAGIGGARIGFDKSNGFSTTKSSDNQFAYQFMTGVSYTPDSMPNTDWSLGYRYLGTSGPSYKTTTGKVSFDNINESNIELGLRYHF